MKKTLTSLVAVMVSAGWAAAENWPNWRGPNGNGYVEDGDAPAEFSGEKNVLWKVKLPGRGCSTPVVWGERIFVTAPVGDEDGIVAYDLEGNELWKDTLGKAKPGRGQRVGSSANSSPVTDGKYVYAYFKSGNVAAYTVEGKKLWQKNLEEEYGEDKLWWDKGTSPVIANGNLVVPVMQTEGKSFLVSLKPEDGDVEWFTPRDYETTAESGDAYTTPHVVEVNGVETIVSWGADHLSGHDAKTGKELWKSAGFNPKKEKMWRVIASSVITEGVCVVPFKRGDALGALKLDGVPTESDEDWLWRKDGLGTDSATPIAAKGRVLVIKDSGKTRGKVSFIEARSGDVLWEDQLPKSVRVYYSSPILAGNTLYMAREDGVVITATVTSKGLKNVKENEMGEGVIASPAVVGDKLFIRGDTHLFCIGK